MKENTVVSIIREVSPDSILEITNCLLDNGISWLEVSLSDEEKGLACIEKISKEFKNEIYLGVGTVTTEKQVDKAIAAGAKYIITPGWDRELVKYILSKDIPVFPGVFSPGEVMQAHSLGVETVKVFPVVNLGLNYIKNLKGPFPNMKFMAVGGVNKQNIIDYKNAGYYSFAIGSDLVPKGASSDDLAHIENSAKEYNQCLAKEE